jgi:hypothetical protein
MHWGSDGISDFESGGEAGRKSLCMSIHFLRKVSLMLFSYQENPYIRSIQLFPRYVCGTIMNVHFAAWFGNSSVVRCMKRPALRANMCKYSHTVVQTLALFAQPASACGTAGRVFLGGGKFSGQETGYVLFSALGEPSNSGIAELLSRPWLWCWPEIVMKS